MKNKFLFISNFGADYQEYMTFHGLCKLLGPENVVVYPFKNTFTGKHDDYPERQVGQKMYLGPQGAWNELWTDKSLYHIWDHAPSYIPRAHDGPPAFYEPIQGLQKYPFEYIVEGCRSGLFPFIFLGSARWYSSITVSELREILKPNCPPVVFQDGEDYYQIRWDFVNAFQTPVYLKRTFYDGWTDIQNPREPTRPKFYPCCFSTLWDVPWVPWEERKIDLFCVFGATQVLREKVRGIVEEVGTSYPGLCLQTAVGHPLSHEEYMYCLSHSKIVVDHQRLGTDTVRTWEVLSSGPCMVGDLHIKMPYQLIPGKHFIQYENDMSPEGDKQKLDTLRSALHYAIQRLDTETKAIAEAGYKHVREYHTTKARAKYVLDCIKASGLSIGDLG